MRVGFLTAELAPLAHVGGLGDVSRWLPETLAAGGDDVALFLPHYDVVDDTGAEHLGELDVGVLGAATLSVLRAPAPGRPAVYLIGHPSFRRGAIYGTGTDEHLRFALFTAAVPAACRRLDWVPQVFHANDWHTALLPALAGAAGPPWDRVPVVLTIHNLAFQGVFPASDLARMGLGPGLAENGSVNSLAAGIRGAAVVTTVSPTYAREILTPERGQGLHEVLAAGGNGPVGILTGIGPDWGPATDPLIPHRYDTPEGKAPNGDALRGRLGLGAGPILGVVSRLTRQKGFGLLGEALVPLLDRGEVQLAAVGTGEEELEALFAGLGSRYPDRVGFHLGFDTELGHLIEAGADMFLMPSHFEPCGLNQMYSMRYGTPPVVRRTGGLADTVEQWDPVAGTGTGFLFDEFTSEALAGALRAALGAFRDRSGWRRLMANGMARDFSWEARAAEYRAVYRRAAGPETIRRGGQGR